MIIASHALGGWRNSYRYLGEHWASHGFAAVHVEHPGSSRQAFEGLDGARRQAAIVAAGASGLERVRDISFVIDALAREAATGGRLAGRVDPGRIGLVGHAFGGWTTQVAGGMKLVREDGVPASHAEPRLTAIIPMSPDVPAARSRLGELLADMALPVLYITGGRDVPPVGRASQRPEDARLVFDHSPPGHKYLLGLKDATHGTFSGPTVTRGQTDLRLQAHIKAATTAFWDAYLKDDAAARAWLSAGGIGAAVGADGTFETGP